MASKAPALPLAPIEYSQQYQDQLNGILRLYFNQVDNPGSLAGSASGVGTTKVVAALNFSQPTAAGGTQYSFPTQADLTNLRVGDVYVDTSAGNVLKMKTS
jgi:hypothetical protein